MERKENNGVKEERVGETQAKDIRITVLRRREEKMKKRKN